MTIYRASGDFSGVFGRRCYVHTLDKVNQRYSNNKGFEKSKKPFNNKSDKSKKVFTLGESVQKKSRLFDPHTISIYAHNISTRTGNHRNALSILLNRLESKNSAMKCLALYNSALSICSKMGAVRETGKILEWMGAEGFKGDEHTICSTLLTLNTWLMQITKNAREANQINGNVNTNYAEEKRAKKITWNDDLLLLQVGEEKVIKPISPQAFSITNTQEAFDLALLLFEQWTTHKQILVSSFISNAKQYDKSVDLNECADDDKNRQNKPSKTAPIKTKEMDPIQPFNVMLRLLLKLKAPPNIIHKLINEHCTEMDLVSWTTAMQSSAKWDTIRQWWREECVRLMEKSGGLDCKCVGVFLSAMQRCIYNSTYRPSASLQNRPLKTTLTNKREADRIIKQVKHELCEIIPKLETITLSPNAHITLFTLMQHCDLLDELKDYWRGLVKRFGKQNMNNLDKIVDYRSFAHLVDVFGLQDAMELANGNDLFSKRITNFTKTWRVAENPFQV